MNIAYHELINRSTLQVDPNKDVNEVCAIIRAAEKNGCVILGGGSPKNFYLQGQPTLWEVYGILKGGNDYFIQITTDSVVWGGLSGATPAEAVSWGKVNPSVLPDTAVAYCDSTIAFPLFCEYAVGHKNGRRQRKALLSKRDRAGERARARSAEEDKDSRSKNNEIEERDRNQMGTLWSELGPVADAVTDRPRVYADANVPAGIVGYMREQLRWDVLFVMDHPDLRRARDTEHYRLARQLRRTLVTLDRDYLDDRKFPPAQGSGVLVIAAPDERGLAKLLARLDAHLFAADTLPLDGRKLHAHSDWQIRSEHMSDLTLGVDVSDVIARLAIVSETARS